MSLKADERTYYKLKIYQMGSVSQKGLSISLLTRKQVSIDSVVKTSEAKL